MTPNTHTSLTLPFTMVEYCEPCGCSLPPNSLAAHSKGKKHRRNIAANGATDPVTQQSLPPPSHHPPTSLPSTSSPAITAPAFTTTDACVTVSHEDGLDLEVEGTEIAGQPPFPRVDLVILIEKTEVVSSLSISALKLVLSQGTPKSWYGLFDA